MAQQEHEWFCGPFKREGLAKYVHMIRGPYDPERSSREARKGQTLAWRGKIKATSTKAWEAKLLEHLADGEPRTFNRIAVELLDQTADIAGEPITDALWELHAQCKVECTNDAPIYFRVKGSKREPAGKPGQMPKKHLHKQTQGIYADAQETKDDLGDEIARSAMDEDLVGSDPDADAAAPAKARAPKRAKASTNIAAAAQAIQAQHGVSQKLAMEVARNVAATMRGKATTEAIIARTAEMLSQQEGDTPPPSKPSKPSKPGKGKSKGGAAPDYLARIKKAKTADEGRRALHDLHEELRGISMAVLEDINPPDDYVFQEKYVAARARPVLEDFFAKATALSPAMGARTRDLYEQRRAMQPFWETLYAKEVAAR